MVNTTRKRRSHKKKKIAEIEEKQLETQELVEDQCETQNLCNGVDADLEEDADLQDDDTSQKE